MTDFFKKHLDAKMLSEAEEDAKIKQAVALFAEVMLSRNKKSFCTTDNADRRALVNDIFPTNFMAHKNGTRGVDIFLHSNLITNRITIALEHSTETTVADYEKNKVTS